MKPKILGKRMLWGGKRPYQVKLDRFVDFKLGKYKDYHIRFHFLSLNKGEEHWGLTERISLILDNVSGVNKLAKHLA